MGTGEAGIVMGEPEMIVSKVTVAGAGGEQVSKRSARERELGRDAVGTKTKVRVDTVRGREPGLPRGVGIGPELFAEGATSSSMAGQPSGTGGGTGSGGPGGRIGRSVARDVSVTGTPMKGDGSLAGLDDALDL
ncbi:hypothetical protein KEM55_005080 [Ascosphaera atra]|nr:hypothetical protein KEM55_005080 [Ascosphaera atra]